MPRRTWRHRDRRESTPKRPGKAFIAMGTLLGATSALGMPLPDAATDAVPSLALPPAQAQLRVNSERLLCFYAQERALRHGSSPGHASVQFLPVNNDQRDRQDLVYGHHPQRLRDVMGGPGVIHQEPERPWDWKICYPVTVAEYNDAAEKVRGKIDAGDPYHLRTANCVDWVQAVASEAGIALPNADGLLGTQDPNALAETLEDAGDGSTIGAGTVHENDGTPPTSMGGSADPQETHPSFCSVEGIEEGAFESMEAQAVYLGHEPQRAMHPTVVSLDLGGTLEVVLSNARLPDAWVALDWGDDSPRERGTATASHVYTTPGTHMARALVVNSGAFHELVITVDVGTGPSTHTVTHTVDDPPGPLEGVSRPVITPVEDETEEPGSTSQPGPAGPSAPAVPAASAIGLGAAALIMAVVGSARLRRRRGRARRRSLGDR